MKILIAADMEGVSGVVHWDQVTPGHFGVPVILISGDQTVCAEARQLLGDLEGAVVKQASGRMAAECPPPAVSQQAIYEAARRAIESYKDGQAPKPFKFDPPITMQVDFVQSEMADRAMIMPGARRLQDRQVSYTASDMPTIYAAFRTLLALARA